MINLILKKPQYCKSLFLPQKVHFLEKSTCVLQLQKRYMYKGFLCGNATFNSKLMFSPQKNLLPAVFTEIKEYGFTKSQLIDLKKESLKLKEEVVALNKENLARLSEVRELLKRKKIEEINYENRMREERYEMISNKKIEMISKGGLSEPAPYNYKFEEKASLLQSKDYDDAVVPYKKSTYEVPSIKHGFSGYYYQNEEGVQMIAFTFHSSKEEFNIFGTTIKNIKINEELNPILYTNPIHIMVLDDFKKIFRVESPTQMVTKKMFSKGTTGDAAYCAYRSFIKSVEHGESTIVLLDNSIKNFHINEVINIKYISDENTVLTPAQVYLNKSGVDIRDKFAEDIVYIEKIKDDGEGKYELYQKSVAIFNEIF